MKKELSINILVIVLLILLEFVWDFIRASNSIPPLYSILFTITFSISFFSVYLINYYVVLPKFLLNKQYVSLGFSFVFFIFIFAGIRFFLEEIILPATFGFHNYNLQQDDIVFIYLWDSFGFAFKAILYSVIVFLFFRYREQKNKVFELSLQHQQAQLTTLKSQISPHFLFNTLNNFYVDLIDDKPETANDILKLSNLMRYVTYETSDDFVPLSKEIDFIKDYLHFYKRRYEDNLQIQFSVNGEVENQQIPTLILIHFIENVCKHGIINDKNRPAKIGINISENNLEVLTENYINTSEKYMGTGIGTENIKKRLSVIFDNNYTLTNEKNNSIFKSYLKIPMK